MALLRFRFASLHLRLNQGFDSECLFFVAVMYMPFIYFEGTAGYILEMCNILVVSIDNFLSVSLFVSYVKCKTLDLIEF